jgi:hypothetical protein
MNTIDGYPIEYWQFLYSRMNKISDRHPYKHYVRRNVRVLDEYNQAGEKLIFIPPVNYERVR